MNSITKLLNKYTRKELYDYLKIKNVNGCSRLKKCDLIKKIIEHQFNKKNHQRFSEFKFDDSIFSTDKPNQKYNQFKFDESIFSTDKPVQEIPRVDRDIDIRDGSTRNWHNMVHDYTMYCNLAKHDLVRFLYNVSEKCYKIIQKELKIKNSVSIQLVAIVDYIEVNLSGERVNTHRNHF